MSRFPAFTVRYVFTTPKPSPKYNATRLNPVLQRPGKDSLKSKVRHLARLQHLSVSAITKFCDQLVIDLLLSTLLRSTVRQSPRSQLGSKRSMLVTYSLDTCQTVHVFLVQICSHNILGQMQLDDVWFCLLRHATKGADSPDDSRLHYDDFCQVKAPPPTSLPPHTHSCRHKTFHSFAQQICLRNMSACACKLQCDTSGLLMLLHGVLR